MVAPKQFESEIPDIFASFEQLLKQLEKATDDFEGKPVQGQQVNLEIHTEVLAKSLCLYRQRATELETRASLLLNRIKKMR
jgi:hypothetical protein